MRDEQTPDTETARPQTHARTNAGAPSIDSARIAEISLGTTKEERRSERRSSTSKTSQWRTPATSRCAT